MDIQKEYEKLFPMTTWSDEEIAEHMFDGVDSYINENIEDDEEIPEKLDVPIEEYAKEHGLIHIDTILNEIAAKLRH